MDEERLIVSLEARIRDFERNMQKAERRGTRSYTALTSGSRRATTAMERDMIQSTTRINQALATTSTRIGAFGKAFAVGAVTTGIAAITTGATRAVRSLAEIDQQARRAGLSVQAFQELVFVSEQNRISVDQLVDGFKELQLRADEFIETGKGSAAEAFARLGFEAQDLKRRLEDPSELFLEIVGRLEDLDRAAQIRIADEIFGGTGGERFVELLAQGEDGIRGMMTRANEFGVVMDEEAIAKAAELDRKFIEISQRVSTLAKTLVVNLADGIQQALTVDVDEIFGSAERAIAMMGDANYEALKRGADITDDQRRSAEDIRKTYEELFRAIQAATGPDGLRLMDVADIAEAHDLASILQDIEAQMRAFQSGAVSAKAFEDELEGLVEEARELIDGLDAVDAQRFGNVVSSLDGIGRALAQAAQGAAQLRAELPEGDPGPIITYGPSRRPERVRRPRNAPEASARPPRRAEQATGGLDVGSGGGGEDGFENQLRQTRERIALLEAEAVALAAVATAGREYGSAVDYARKRAELLTQAMADGRDITPALSAEIDALARAYADAGDAADVAADRLNDLQSNAARVADRMTDAFVGIIDGSKSAKEALRDLLNAFLEMQLRQALFVPLNAASQQIGAAIGGAFGMYASGGYTGDGARHQPAGIVHRGEYVVRADMVRRPGVRSFLEALNDGTPGFAEGGYVGSVAPAPAVQHSTAPASGPQAVDNSVVINNQWNLSANGDDAVRRIVAAETGNFEQRVAATIARAKRTGRI